MKSEGIKSEIKLLEEKSLEISKAIIEQKKLLYAALADEAGLTKGDKVAFLSREPMAVTAFFNVLMNEDKSNVGEFNWGSTITKSFLPNENSKFFTGEYNLVDWLRQFSQDKTETYVST